MPELPEVEPVRRTPAPHLVGRTVTAVEVYDAGILRRPTAPAPFAAALVGRSVRALGRRGKYLRMALSDGGEWIVHLRMSGRLLWHRELERRERFLRLRAVLDDGSLLDYIDMRRLGGMHLVDADGVGAPAGLGRLGPDAVDPAFTPAHLAGVVRGRRATIKGILLDQRTVAGLGNIYVDEALHAARLHPMRTGGSLRPAEVRRLHAAIVAVVREGIRAQGVSFALYRDGEGRPGEMGERLQVYGRAGQACYACGGTIARARVAGRGTAYCPRCQPEPRRRRTGGARR
jgi:formamidopyrimidine-DNA glycosylase